MEVPPLVLQVLDYNGGRTLEDLIKYVEDRVAGEPIGDDDDDDDDASDADDDDTDAESEDEGEPAKDEL